ncbi:MAG: hypothetical protein PHP22_07785 [Oscillospiraceae bacterium]|nr:hypothetical protein [Oscillospiraceae bacterium]
MYKGNKNEGSHIYTTNAAFTVKSAKSLGQMTLYYNFLLQYGIYLEDVIVWFFSHYLISEFSAPHFRIAMPSHGTTYSEKCVSVCIAIDSILKQFAEYAQKGSLNFELLRMSSAPARIIEIPSLSTNKYAYSNGETLNGIADLIFSDQSTLSFISRLQGKHDTFYELITSEVVYISDYEKWDVPRIDFLKKNHLITIDNSGIISFCDFQALIIIRDIFLSEVINIRHYPSKMQEKIKCMEKAGYLRFGNTLLSKPEIDYFNYCLNKSEFANGLDLRNSYVHGIMQTEDNESIHKNNFFTLLKLFILLVIKINDEFCQKNEDREST